MSLSPEELKELIREAKLDNKVKDTERAMEDVSDSTNALKVSTYILIAISIVGIAMGFLTGFTGYFALVAVGSIACAFSNLNAKRDETRKAIKKLRRARNDVKEFQG